MGYVVTVKRLGRTIENDFFLYYEAANLQYEKYSNLYNSHFYNVQIGEFDENKTSDNRNGFNVSRMRAKPARASANIGRNAANANSF